MSTLPDRTPREIRIAVGDTVAARGNILDASVSIVNNESEGQLAEDISRIQSAVFDYNASFPYKAGDKILKSGVELRALVAIPIPESFDSAKWTSNIWTRLDTNIFPTTLTDSVGIGLIAPLAKLHIRSLPVTGDITVDGDSDDLFIENQGNAGYTSLPTVTIAPPPDTETTTGTAVLTTGVKEVTITNPGSDYTFATVTFTGGGTPTRIATGTAVLGGGQLLDVTIDDKGAGYSSPPTAVIAGNGTDAAGTAVLTSFITSITIINTGSGNVDIPTITIGAASGGGPNPVDATAVAVLVNTEVTTINMTEEGQDYGSIPSVSFTPAPTAITATAEAVVVDEKVVSVNLIGPGFGGRGYKVPPSVVTFDGGGGNGVGIDTVTVANSSIQSITVTQGGAGLTIISEPDQVGVVAFSTGGTTTTTEKILFDHSTERMRFIVDSVQGLIIDNLGHVAISQDNVTHAEVFTVDTDVLNVPVRILIRDSIDRLMLGYNGSDNFVTDATQAQVIVQTDSADLSIASGGAEASNLRFYTSDVSGLEERMIITNEGRVGVNVVNPLRTFQVGDQANTSTGIMRFAHKTASNFRSWDVGVGEGATFGTNDNFGIIDVGHPDTVFVIRATSGNVGMGIPLPAVKLHVVGTTGVKFEGGALDMTTQQIKNVEDPTAAQDVTTLNYVDTNFVSISGTQTITGAKTFTDLVNLNSDGVNGAEYRATGYTGTGLGGIFVGRRAGGSESSPTAIQTNDIITAVEGWGYDGNSFEPGAFWCFSASENWSDGVNGCRFDLYTTANGTAANLLRFRILDDGTSEFENNPIINIASIGLKDSDNSNTYTILGGALTGDFNVTIPAISANDTFALVGVANNWGAVNQNISATGAWQEGGVKISPIGKNTKTVNAVDFATDVVAGAALATFDTLTNAITYRAIVYTAAMNLFSTYEWIPPTEWDGGTVSISLRWSSPNGTVTQDVNFEVAANAFSQGDTFDIVYPTPTSILDELTTVSAPETTDETVIPIGNTPVKGDVILFRIERDAAVAPDTLTGAVRLEGMEIFYTTDAANSA